VTRRCVAQPRRKETSLAVDARANAQLACLRVSRRAGRLLSEGHRASCSRCAGTVGGAALSGGTPRARPSQ
jgi:hypothetical protein